MAESVLRDRLDAAGLADRVIVESAGTSGWHEGEDADPRARHTLERSGYSLTHSARQFRPDWFTRTDLVLAMDGDNLDDLTELAAKNGTHNPDIRLFRSFDETAEPEAVVPDPYYGGHRGFEVVLAMIERAADGVTEYVLQESASRELPA